MPLLLHHRSRHLHSNTVAFDIPVKRQSLLTWDNGTGRRQKFRRPWLYSVDKERLFILQAEPEKEHRHFIKEEPNITVGIAAMYCLRA